MILRYAASCSLSLLAFFALPTGSRAQTEPTPAKKEEGARVRIVCVQSLSGNKSEEVTLAKQTEDGSWIEFGDLELRSPFITDWVRVSAGLNHVVRKEGGELSSLGSFNVTANMKSAVLIMIPNVQKNNYRLQVIDPAKLEFRKGKALVVNYSTLSAMVNMGKETKTLAPGQQLIETMAADKEGMHRMLIAHLDKDKKIVPCYDRYVSSNPNTRKFILLFPDPDTGLRAMTLTEFGPFE
jgi:hypothetical protein